MRTAEHDERVMEAVEAAALLPPERREGYLRANFLGDEELLRECSEQLQWQERMGGFLLQPLATLGGLDRPFTPGQIVSERFQIVREIGEGGMGVVFEAFDLKRNTRIAVKAAKSGYGRLLTPELAGALRVRHPNVCLVNEIHTALTEEGEVDFLTMEFLEGETLRDRLCREGKIAPGEMREIARQLCAGLSEAHRSGVIHRDLKSGNVILSVTAEGALRAVITDFGLSGPVVSGHPETGGTPAYMAPELLMGTPASTSSDIFALGVILYEALTGQQPDAPPDAPGKLVEGLDARWDRAVLACLHPDPRYRPAESMEIVASLDKKRRSKLLYVAAALLAAAGSFPQVRNPVLQFIWPPHVRLAVLPFTTPANAGEQMGGALQDTLDRLRPRQSGGRPIVIIPPAELAANGVHNSAEAGRILHATHTLDGGLSQTAAGWIAEANLIEVQTQTRLSRFSERYSTDSWGVLPKALAGSVSLALRLQGKAPAEDLSPTASRNYLKALYFLRRDLRSFDEAIPLLEKAQEADPHSPLPLAGLTEAWLLKFQFAKERSSLEKAQEYYSSAEALNADSVRVRLVGGMLNEAAGKYEKAVADYSRVLELEPRNVQAMQGIANAYDSLDMPEKAVQSFRKAIQAEPDYYAPYQDFGIYYYYRGKYHEAAVQFQNAIDRAPGLVKAYTNLAAALNDLGLDAQAEQALQASLRLKTTASALNSMGAIRVYQGRHAEAAAYFERAYPLDPHNYVILMNLADGYRRTGRATEAMGAYRKAMEEATIALRDNPRRGNVRAFAGYFASRLGDRRRAADEIAQALQFSPSDQQVIRQSVLAYEVLGERERTIATLHGATHEMMNELARQPDLIVLQRDPRFVEMHQAAQAK